MNLNNKISPLANIHPNAKIGDNVTIDPFVTIYDNVEVGEGTWIGPNAVLMSGARVGKFCRIFPGAVISAIPQDLKFSGEDTTAIIGNNTTIREFVTINRGTKDRHHTKVGNNCLIMAYCHIAHDAEIGNNVILANSVNLAGHVTIDDFVIIEGVVAIQQFVKIGAHSFITGGSLVRKNVPPFVKAAREPLSYVGINSVGLRRRGFTDKQILEIEDIYRTIYVRGYNVSNALSIVEAEAPKGDEKSLIINFIRDSTNGIMRGVASN
ncbi:MAG: acyl-ACP--UDP-N-acetylglucosamine O-acyltransferase [Bacteroidia bacterium]|nr:acyl-ACP--UDP-N-acetylglucosamine O-acyltransferase [Bacteroidia bacterium]